MRFPSALILDLQSKNSVNSTIFKTVLILTNEIAPSQQKRLSSLVCRKRPLKANLNPLFKLPRFTSSKFSDIWTTHFIRKEFMYTKLKYSRTPSYDIVSGGFALLFAGFLGFLTTEKFGFELVDSGDFYFMGMYLIILIFPLRLLLRTCFHKKDKLTFFNIKGIWTFLISVKIIIYGKR